jgi:hypothetical protein
MGVPAGGVSRLTGAEKKPEVALARAPAGLLGAASGRALKLGREPDEPLPGRPGPGWLLADGPEPGREPKPDWPLPG